MTQGMVVREYDPYWRVVQPLNRPGKDQYVVVDVSGRPVVVFGPNTRQECESFAHINQQIWIITHVQVEQP